MGLLTYKSVHLVFPPPQLDIFTVIDSTITLPLNIVSNSQMVRTINVKLWPVDLSHWASKESVHSDAVTPQEDGYLEPSLICRTLRIGVGSNSRLRSKKKECTVSGIITWHVKVTTCSRVWHYMRFSTDYTLDNEWLLVYTKHGIHTILLRIFHIYSTL